MTSGYYDWWLYDSKMTADVCELVVVKPESTRAKARVLEAEQQPIHKHSRPTAYPNNQLAPNNYLHTKHFKVCYNCEERTHGNSKILMRNLYPNRKCCDVFWEFKHRIVKKHYENNIETRNECVRCVSSRNSISKQNKISYLDKISCQSIMFFKPKILSEVKLNFQKTQKQYAVSSFIIK